jgi:hypothetical protein
MARNRAFFCCIPPPQNPRAFTRVGAAVSSERSVEIRSPLPLGDLGPARGSARPGVPPARGSRPPGSFRPGVRPPGGPARRGPPAWGSCLPGGPARRGPARPGVSLARGSCPPGVLPAGGPTRRGSRLPGSARRGPPARGPAGAFFAVCSRSRVFPVGFPAGPGGDSWWVSTRPGPKDWWFRWLHFSGRPSDLWVAPAQQPGRKNLKEADP